jgi:hypothetical protein
MASTKSFRDLKVYRSWLDDALDAAYLSAVDFEGLNNRYYSLVEAAEILKNIRTLEIWSSHSRSGESPWSQFTVRSALLLVTLSAALLTTTEKRAPLSAGTVGGVV